MTKKKTLVRHALDNPHLYSPAELQYFRLWLEARANRKERKRQLKVLELEKALLKS